MAEILKAMPAAAPQAVGRIEDPRNGETNASDPATGAPASFADILKSVGDKALNRFGKSSAEELPIAAAAAAAIADPAAAADSLLPMLAPDAPAAAAPDPAVPAAAAPTQPDAAAMALVEAPRLELPALPPTAIAAVQPATPATPDAASSAMAPAPTMAAPALPAVDVQETHKEKRGQPGHAPAAPVAENHARPDKLAVDAANTAEPAKAGKFSDGREPESGDFRAVIERVANNPAASAAPVGEAKAATTRVQELPLQTHLGRAGWHDEVAQKLTWMAGNNRQQADLVLNPPQLGRIEVSMRFDGDQLSASFASPHAAVRETLENSMLRLREVLADAGISLGQTHVGADCRHDSKAMNPGLARSPTDRALPQVSGLPGAGPESASPWRIGGGRGMVDTFA